ncbi:TrwC protein, partial [mine drainage metagenome]
EEIVRQRHDGLRQAVYDALAGKTAEALSRVQVFEIKQGKPDRAAADRSEIDAGSDHALAQSAEIRREELREAAIAAIVNRYQYWTEAEKDVLVIALSRADREALNEALHAEKPGRNDPRPVDTLDSKQWTAAQRSDAARYRPGDQIEWGRDYQDGPRKGEITPVVAQRDGQVTAQRADGTQWTFDPRKITRFEVSDAKQLRLGEGSKIITRGPIEAQRSDGTTLRLPTGSALT